MRWSLAGSDIYLLSGDLLVTQSCVLQTGSLGGGQTSLNTCNTRHVVRPLSNQSTFSLSLTCQATNLPPVSPSRLPSSVRSYLSTNPSSLVTSNLSTNSFTFITTKSCCFIPSCFLSLRSTDTTSDFIAGSLGHLGPLLLDLLPLSLLQLPGRCRSTLLALVQCEFGSLLLSSLKRTMELSH